MDSFSWQNIIDGRGIDIAGTGMLIVFFALALISLCVAMLHRALNIVDRFFPQAAPAAAPSDDDEAAVAAIGYVLHQNRRIYESTNQKG